MTALNIDTSDPAEVESLLSSNFATTRLSVASRGPTPLRLTRSFVGSMAVDSAEYGVAFGFTMEPPEQIVLCRVLAGGVEHHGTNEATTRIGSGQVGVIGAFGSADGPVSGRVLRGRTDHLVLHPRRLGENASPSPRSDGVVRLTGPSPVSPAAGRLLARTMEYVKSCAAQRLTDANPLLAAILEHHVATVLLATVPNTALLEPTIEDRHDSTPVLLRRATAYIDDNAYRDIALSDIAETIYVTPRALQYMFRKHLDCTPMEYLRRVRLHHVHLDLKDGDRSHTTVAQIARRWGFGHLGRFAVYYREQYGESPHETLRR